nr:2-hydroxyacyl-CoA dehydratase family protein [Parafannyhessea umbonata]
MGENTCDGKKKAYEQFSKLKPMYIMDVPHVRNEDTKLQWRHEVHALATRIEEETGQKITEESLRAAIKLANDKRSAPERLSATRAANPVPISGLGSLLTVQAVFMEDSARLTGAINEMASGVVVGEECCTGSRYYKDLVPEDGATVDEMFDDIADRYLNIQCAIFTPYNGRRDDVICMARELHADGIIDASPLVLHDSRDGGVRHGEGRAGDRHPLYAPLDRLLLRGRRPAYDPHPGVSRDDLGVCRAFSIGAGQPLFVWPHLCPSGSLWCGGKSVCVAKEEEESPAGGRIPTARGVYQIYKLFVWQSD